MSFTITSINGVLHGKTIELSETIDLPEGANVVVSIRLKDETAVQASNGIERSAGSWGDDPEGVDSFVKWTYEQRKLDRKPVVGDS